MKLPIPFLNTKKANSDYYLALILTDEKASAVILQATDGSLKTISSHEEYFDTSVENLNLEEFINALDKTISRAEEVLPPDIETHQTVFGVKEQWVDTETKKIKKEHLDKLKKVCDALDLSPVGFMVTTEAVIHLIQDEEGAPLSAVLAEIGKRQVSLHLLRGGKFIESISGPHGESAPATVDKLLGHFTVPVLPARIVLFLNKPDERTQQAFIAHQWSKSLPFLHMPQVNILPQRFDSRAVMYGAATQMGFTVSDTFDPIPSNIDLAESNEIIPDEHISDDNLDDSQQIEANVERDEPHMDNFTPVSEEQEHGGDFGFVVNGEAKEAPIVHHQTHHEEAKYDEEHPVEHNPEFHHDQAEDIHDHQRHENSKSNKLSKSIWTPLTSILSLKHIKLPKFGHLTKVLGGNKTIWKIILPLAVIILAIGAIAYFYMYNVKATVSLIVTPNKVDQEEQVIFSTSAANDFSKNILAARSISASIDGDVSTDATGKKDVGEKAKGSITLYNNSNDVVNLSSGTEIKASSGQIFTLDNDAKIPAASGDIFTGTKPGTTQTAVTAKELGTEGNLPSGTRFTAGTNSDIAAKNDSAFSGGTKKNVTVVSKDDLAKLRIELPKKVQKDALDKLKGQAESDETVLPVTADSSLQKEKFDKKEGEEAKKVTLHGTVVFAGMTYNNNSLDDYAQTIIKGKYDQDVTLEKDSVQATIKNTKSKDAKSANATVTIQAGLLPKINTQDVIENIADKSLNSAKDTIANLPQVAKTDITFSPPIPLLPEIFPRLPKQISVEVKTQ